MDPEFALASKLTILATFHFQASVFKNQFFHSTNVVVAKK